MPVKRLLWLIAECNTSSGGYTLCSAYLANGCVELEGFSRGNYKAHRCGASVSSVEDAKREIEQIYDVTVRSFILGALKPSAV
jgi:hypothetical protein